MTKLITYLSTAVALASLTGCKKSATSCESLYEHTLALAPADIKSLVEQGKADAIAKCEQMPEEARKCAADAETLEALRACKPSRTHAAADRAAVSDPPPAAKPVEASPATTPGDAQSIEQLADRYTKDKSIKGTHVTVKGLYMTTTQGADHRPIAISLKSGKDALQILDCDAGSDLATFATAEHGTAQWTAITVEGDIAEKNWQVALTNCSIHKS
jgi:hypothetical protein